MELPYDPAILLLDTYAKELKARNQIDICTSVIIEMFTIVKKWKLGIVAEG